MNLVKPVVLVTAAACLAIPSAPARAQESGEPRARPTFEFRGRLLINAFTNSRRVNSTGNPAYVRPDDPGDPEPAGLAMHARQSSVGVTIRSSDVLGGHLTGDVEADFHGGQFPSSGGRTSPLLRLRTFHVAVGWDHGEVLVGQTSPLIAGVSPVSLAAVATPGLAAAGNLWLWLPQIRGSWDFRGNGVRLGVQGALVAPSTGTPVGSFDVPDFDAAERSSRPFVQSRVRVRWGTGELAGEAGIGRQDAWFQLAGTDLSHGAIAVATFEVPLTRRFEIRGEAYDGRGARALGGAIGQLFGVNGTIVRSRGGWAQANVRWPTAVAGIGYGVEDPHDTDLAASARLENSAMSVHAEWRPGTGPLVLASEYRRIRTRYLPRSFSNDHLNFAFGLEF